MPLAPEDASGVGALADPIRRRLYEFVAAQPTATSREQAAAAVGIPVHQAKFHLDKLEAEGLFETEYARTHGRGGPGAGRPAKLYRRAERHIEVSLPDRKYRLAGQLMADAIATSTANGIPVAEALDECAHACGRAWGEAVAAPPSDSRAAVDLAAETLAGHGYEPRFDDSRLIMVNCPFHALAQTQTELVCQMNHALITGFTETLAPHSPTAELDPGPGRCCVVLTAAAP